MIRLTFILLIIGCSLGAILSLFLNGYSFRQSLFMFIPFTLIIFVTIMCLYFSNEKERIVKNKKYIYLLITPITFSIHIFKAFAFFPSIYNQFACVYIAQSKKLVAHQKANKQFRTFEKLVVETPTVQEAFC